MSAISSIDISLYKTVDSIQYAILTEVIMVMARNSWWRRS